MRTVSPSRARRAASAMRVTPLRGHEDDHRGRCGGAGGEQRRRERGADPAQQMRGGHGGHAANDPFIGPAAGRAWLTEGQRQPQQEHQEDGDAGHVHHAVHHPHGEHAGEGPPGWASQRLTAEGLAEQPHGARRQDQGEGRDAEQALLDVGGTNRFLACRGRCSWSEVKNQKPLPGPGRRWRAACQPASTQGRSGQIHRRGPFHPRR